MTASVWQPGDRVRVCEILGKACKAEIVQVRKSWDRSEGFGAQFHEREKIDVQVRLLENSSKGHKAGSTMWVPAENVESEEAWKA